MVTPKKKFEDTFEPKHILFWSDRSKVGSILVNIYNIMYKMQMHLPRVWV